MTTRVPLLARVVGLGAIASAAVAVGARLDDERGVVLAVAVAIAATSAIVAAVWDGRSRLGCAP